MRNNKLKFLYGNIEIYEIIFTKEFNRKLIIANIIAIWIKILEKAIFP
jgi:hypothetical protein